ncbi:hypothetical protein C8A05DRAFT_31548 [Staphylotrichum tortipilum]|uniref:DNA replication regulator SLD2 n=1 Tax=Staphylotrichum tortipilum TaxID=2831512 RepID=A0AAN6RWG6_9PEZI|nr:hypothetical protein C8A05DRAFT_31548 [Staphylotrichum longicolle]
MEDQDQAVAALESESLQLRADLKTWEGEWAAAHGGKKPGRRDIKQNPDIGKLPPGLAHLQPEPVAVADVDPEASHGSQQLENQNHQGRKRTQSDAALPPQTPSKRARPAQTPRKQQPLAPLAAMSPEARTPSAAIPSHLGTPAAAVPTSISPTPQKDGRVLGLFDLLSRTPSRAATVTSMTLHSFSAVTPSKHRTSGTGDASIITSQVATTTTTTTTTTITTPSTARFATTPQSKRTTRQILFHASSSSSKTKAVPNADTTPFMTPSTSRMVKLPDTTPTTSTPSFLRRRTTAATASTALTTTLSRVDEQDEDSHQPGAESGVEDDGDGYDGQAWKKVGPLRLPRKMDVIGRGLSSVVAGLRKMEEEAFADEEEAMREMEMGENTATAKRVEVTVARTSGEVEVGDSQAPAALLRHPPKGGPVEDAEPPAALLSGFDNDAAYDSPDESQKPGQPPLRVFKKRGQKRTTRRANMRPTRTRRPTQTDPGTDEESAPDDDDLVPETQLHPADLDAEDPALSDASFDSDSDSGGTKKKKAPAPATANKDAGEGVVKRAVRKVKATAHANFKRLKLRSGGAKGGPGYGSRFRRRR